MFEEFGDWITVGVRFLLDNLDQTLEGISSTGVDDDSGGQITQDVWAHRLNGIQVEGLVQEHFND